MHWLAIIKHPWMQALEDFAALPPSATTSWSQFSKE